jgi:hypothetical protein
MSLLGRFFGSRDDVPAWARFFPAEDYRAFLEAVEGDLRRRGAQYEMGDGTVRAGPASGPTADYGLLNLAQVCHASPAGSGRRRSRATSTTRSRATPRRKRSTPAPGRSRTSGPA